MNFYKKLGLLLALAALLICVCAVATAEDHEFTEYVGYTPATCTTPAYETWKCKDCTKTERRTKGSADPNAHSYGGWIVDEEASCEENGSRHRVCQYCGKIDTDTIKASGHTLGSWTQTKAPTCTEAGEETQSCTKCNHLINTRTIKALGHDYKENITKQPTCTEAGEATYTCSHDSSHTYTATVKALGHNYKREVTKEPTCTETGEATYTCQNDSSHTYTETIKATGHNWQDTKIDKQPTCTEPGSKTQTCKNDSSHTRTVSIPATGHQHTHWVTTKEPTYTEQGERKLYCDDCGALIRTAKIGVKMFYNNTICAIGPRLRDVNLSPYNSDNWYMFTPFDASKDGVQTYTLIGSNKYDVGSCTITVRDGTVTVDYHVYPVVDVNLEFFTILNQMSDLHEYEPEALSSLALQPGRAYNIETEFSGDTNLVLYFCSRADYAINRYVESANLSTPYRELCRGMLSMMDK